MALPGGSGGRQQAEAHNQASLALTHLCHPPCVYWYGTTGRGTDKPPLAPLLQDHPWKVRWAGAAGPTRSAS